jgi:hypothetical protein
MKKLSTGTFPCMRRWLVEASLVFLFFSLECGCVYWILSMTLN